jgi:hypothetical protein
MTGAEIIEAREEDFKDEVDHITLTPALEIKHPVAFKDGSGGLKPPIYDMKALRQWILGHNPTFPHTGLYSDLSQVAPVRWKRSNCSSDEAETARMLTDTQAQLTAEPKPDLIFIFHSPNSPVFRQIMASQFIRQQLNPQLVSNIGWLADYWVHHPYTAYDLNSDVQPIVASATADTPSYADFRLGMAGRLFDDDLFGVLAMSYWCAHPIDDNNDSFHTLQTYAIFHPTVVYSPLISPR